MIGALAAQRGHWCNAELLIEEKLFKPPDLLAEAVAMYRYLCATKVCQKTGPRPVFREAPSLSGDQTRSINFEHFAGR